MIPDEVLETLLHCLDITLGSVDWNRVIMPRIGKHRMQEARAWLESQTTATDKAVCPKCGSDDTSIICHEDVRRAVCRECRFTFPVQVLVISPPRETHAPCPECKGLEEVCSVDPDQDPNEPPSGYLIPCPSCKPREVK